MTPPIDTTPAALIRLADRLQVQFSFGRHPAAGRTVADEAAEVLRALAAPPPPALVQFTLDGKDYEATIPEGIAISAPNLRTVPRQQPHPAAGATDRQAPASLAPDHEALVERLTAKWARYRSQPSRNLTGVRYDELDEARDNALLDAFVADLAALAAAPVPPEPGWNQGWLIEKSDDHTPRYWDGKRISSFTTNHLDAVRFARQEDAARVNEYLFDKQFITCKVVEHLWDAPVPPATAAYSQAATNAWGTFGEMGAVPPATKGACERCHGSGFEADGVFVCAWCHGHGDASALPAPAPP